MKVSRISFLLAISLLFAGRAMAQETPLVEIFGGYTFIHEDLGTGAPPVIPGVTLPSRTTVTSNIHGGSGSIAYNLNDWFGMVADFGGGGISTLHLDPGPDINVSSTLLTYLFGPRLSYRKYSTFTPFAQVLFGGAHITDLSTSGVTIRTSENGFAMTAGGGVDWNVNKRFAVRGQVEYLLTRFTDPFSLTGASGTQNNVRVSTGVVIRFGTK